MQTKSVQQRTQELEEVSRWLVQKIASCAQLPPAEISVYESFASYGLSSTDAVSISGELEEWLGRKLQPTLLYHYPTIDLLARALVDPIPTSQPVSEGRTRERSALATHDIAIIGMAGRFPGASNVDEFWQNLRAGVESIAVFSEEELLAAGCDAEAIAHPAYVRSRPVLKPEEVECFDAAFFGYSPHEAALTDPQHRIFLECSWEALERAGYDPTTYDGLIGVYAGCNLSTYLLALAATEHLHGLDDYQIVIGHDKDSLTSTVSYKLNLKGPSFAVQTFCSTSLVAVYLACQSLIHGEADLALAGGVSIRVPGTIGYHYHEGGMESEDGHCRAFDSEATGTLFGDGAGVVVLKRLQEALRDGDTIDAVIKGAAITNDGSLKMSYTAPGVMGQAAAITKAIEQAGIDASTITYLEAHGSATELGDPIEVAALTRAFRHSTNKQGYCALGSVKTNIGHMDRAAGVAGLIKVIQALKHKELPPTLHVQVPNPKLELEQSPFFLQTSLQPWPAEHGVRRAGVNSLGLGGTNAHVIVEEAPVLPETSSSRPWQWLALSARTDNALAQMTEQLRHYLLAHPDVPLADVAYTLQVGRKKFEQRRVFVYRDRQDALELLAHPDGPQVFEQTQRGAENQVLFLLPGVGEQYPHMAQELYQQEPFFRNEVDRCCQMLHLLLGMDLRSVLYPDSVTLTIPRPNPQIDLHALLRRQADASQLPSAPEALNRTELAQPAVFVIEYALARLLMHWGIRPQAMLGYSLGEYVAATLAGVLSLEDALTLVARRARLIAALPAGAMLSVALSAEDLQAYLQAHEAYEVDLAVIAAPQTCVVSGTPEMIAAFEAALIEDEIACFRVETTHAFHSRMLQPAKKALTQLVKGMLLCPPAIPYISNVTGTWITNQQATSPEYWAEHMCETVRFADGVGCLLQKTSPLLLEVGVGQTLGSFVRQHPACDRARMGQIFATQPARSPEQGYAFFMTSLGRLWLAGVELDWQRFYENEVRRRVPLPTYPFERQRYWIDVQDWRQRSTPTPSGKSGKGLAGERKAEMAHWFSLPSWRQGRPLAPSAIQASGTNWLIFLDEIGYGEALAERLRAAGGQVVTVTPGMGFAHTGDQQYCLDPRNPSGYQRLLQALGAQQFWPEQILHGWSLSPVDASVTSERQLDLSFYSLLALAQALGEVKLEHCTLTILANGLYDVLGHEKLLPEKATLLGPCLVIPQEYAALRCHLLELDLPLSSTATSAVQEALLEQIANELTAETRERIVALRGARRWLPTFEEVQIPEPVQAGYGLRPQGVYLITGGLGGIGLALAETLATVSQARLILIGREGLPERGTWAEVLATTTPDHPFNRRITAIQHIEALGAQVLVLAADVANEAQMREVVEQTRARFGEINGVLHLAGVPGVGLMQLKTRDAAAAVLAPKVQGTLVLERLFQTTPLDFCLLFSSITALTGGPGQVDYSAANAFLDTYARSRQAPYPVVAIDWGEWEWNAWSDGLAGYDEATRIFFEKNRRAFGISLKEGATAFQRLLSSTFAQVIVSTQDIQALVELGATYNIHAELPWQQPQRQTQITHPRPALKNSYIAPRNDDERKMARIWEEQLAIDGIGIYDNFFDLGGNSLLGVNLLIQVRKEFHLEQLPAYVLYESPCVEAMTQYLTQGKQGITVHALDERSSKRQMLMKKRIREKNA